MLRQTSSVSKTAKREKERERDESKKRDSRERAKPSCHRNSVDYGFSIRTHDCCCPIQLSSRKESEIDIKLLIIFAMVAEIGSSCFRAIIALIICIITIISTAFILRLIYD